jgi:malate synthase
VLDEELEKIKTSISPERYAKGKFAVARELFDKITTDDEFVEFLTLPGYEKLD